MVCKVGQQFTKPGISGPCFSLFICGSANPYAGPHHWLNTRTAFTRGSCWSKTPRREVSFARGLLLLCTSLAGANLRFSYHRVAKCDEDKTTLCPCKTKKF